MRALLLALVLLMGAPTLALARPPMETNQLVDGDGNPIGTVANPLNVTSTGGTANPYPGSDYATAARQDAGNTSLTNVSSGIGAASDAGTTSDGAAGSLIAKITRLLGTQTGISTLITAVRDKLPTFGTAGSPSANVLTIQGITGGTPQPVSGSVALEAGTNRIGSILSVSNFSEAFRAALAANATLTGTTRDLGTDRVYTRFGAVVVTDQSGSLQVQASTDGANFITVATQAVAANTPVDLSLPIRARYYRVVYVNGATATGANGFSLLTSFTAG